jgi:nickel-dependent lactate racemase
MTDEQLNRMYAGVPKDRFRVHDWRNDVITIGELPASFVAGVTDGIYDKPWPCQLNKLVWDGGHDLILSIGQVVPHEVSGMANYTKNLFVGTGGAAGIHESHFIGAVYGMERIMGRADTPIRRLLNEGLDRFCADLPVVFVLTVIGREAFSGRLVVRGLFIGDHHDCFEAAASLSVAVNFKILDEEPTKIVCYLDPDEFHSTWLGNKAIYRTRMAIADEGELIILAPGVERFGEDPDVDALIRRHGYRTTPEILAIVESDPDLAINLGAAAHLIHGSSEGRFRVTYCPGEMSQAEVEEVGYDFADLASMTRRYDPSRLREGWNDVNGERVFFISNPALGLWASRSRLGI